MKRASWVKLVVKIGWRSVEEQEVITMSEVKAPATAQSVRTPLARKIYLAAHQSLRRRVFGFTSLDSV
jgi:hypothetical protein